MLLIVSAIARVGAPPVPSAAGGGGCGNTRRRPTEQDFGDDLGVLRGFAVLPFVSFPQGLGGPFFN